MRPQLRSRAMRASARNSARPMPLARCAGRTNRSSRYRPGRPTNVEKLKKYSANPTGVPPHSAISTWITGFDESSSRTKSTAVALASCASFSYSASSRTRLAITAASALVAGRMFSMIVKLLRDEPAVAFAFHHEALVRQSLAADIVDGASTVEVVAGTQLLHDAQRGDHGFARALTVGAGVDQGLACAARGAAIEVRAHVLVVVFLAVAGRDGRLGARQQFGDAGCQRLRRGRGGAGSTGRRRLHGRRASFDEVIELRFDFGRHDGAPLLAVLHQTH